MSEHVIAMDPGGRSGWASARMAEDHFELTGAGVLRQDLMTRWFAGAQAVQFVGVGQPLYVRDRTYDVFVYESWYPRRDGQGKMDWIEGNELDEAQHIGALIFIAEESGARIVTQHPTDKPQAMSTMPARLAELDYYSNEQHDQDARMHLWIYFWRNWFTGALSPNDTIVVA